MTLNTFEVHIRYEQFIESDMDYWRCTGEEWLIQATSKESANLIAKSLFYKEHDPNSVNSSWRDLKVNVHDTITFPYKIRR